MENFHLLTLQNELENRLRQNPSYSLRAFAKDLQVSPSWLSDFLKNKKGLSEKKALEIAARLNLNPKELDLFILSTKASHSRSSKEKNKASLEIKNKSDSFRSFVKVKKNQQTLLNTWYSQAILELTELEDCGHTISWFTKKLGLPHLLVESTIQKLIEHQLLEFKYNKYKAIYHATQSTVDIPSDDIKYYHKDVLEMAKSSIFTDSAKDREINNMTLSFTKSKMTEAKLFIRQFQYDFAEKFYNETDPKDSVYQLSVQFFRLDKNLNENKKTKLQGENNESL